MKLSPHFELSEFVFSQTAIRKKLDNTPPEGAIENMRQLCLHILEPLRNATGKPIRISSGYRSAKVNAAIGSKPNSQHITGQACDFTIPGYTVQQVIAKVQELELPFDQLLNEYDSWVHISYSNRHRRQVLTIK